MKTVDDGSMINGYLQWKPGDETEVKEPCRGLYSGVKVVRGGREWVAKIRIGPHSPKTTRRRSRRQLHFHLQLGYLGLMKVLFSGYSTKIPG